MDPTTDGDALGAILAAGAYAPPYRITADEVADAWGRFDAGGIDRTAVPGADEDALTMGIAAGRRALSAAEVSGSDLEFLAFATTTPPQEEGDLTARLGAALAVPDGATRQSFSASTRAGTRALSAALSADPDPGLVVAADCPRGEPADERDHAAGAGAAAFVVGSEGPAAFVDAAEHADPTPGTRFRRRGSDRVEGLGVTSYDRAAFARTVGAAAEGVGFGADSTAEADAAAVQSPDGAMPYRAADALGVDTGTVAAAETVSDLGDTGAASTPLGLATALGAGHGRILVVGYGSGGAADALLVEAERDPPTALSLEGDRAVSYAEYLRLRGEITPGNPDGGGASVSVPAWKRSLPGRYRPRAGECPECGGLTFPPEGACGECGALVEFETVELGPDGRVEAVTRIGQGGAPPEFAEAQARGGAYGVAIVAVEGPAGGSASVPLQVADGHDAPEVGDVVRAVVRRIYTQEGVTRYGVKARPVGPD
ncbi:ACP synthase [Halobacteriales archaeon QS_8_69_26]|nr:MAG: ACP synthase [Halobacteriales archaeon QS_8_69_26]